MSSLIAMPMDFLRIMKAVGTSMLIAVPFLNADGAPLTPEQALQRLDSGSARFRISGTSSSYRLAYTERAGGQTSLYVFNRGDNGFIVASADDKLPALLGYSDKGSFDPSNASPELKWWLGQYAAEAAYYLQNPEAFTIAPTTRGAAKADRVNIQELLTTLWDQDDPYNLYCPEDGGEKCVTGCVATAMAQIIKYHSYPTHGTGEHSYVWNGQLLSYDYANATFDYANMLDEYVGNATEAQREAVANLMYACGVGVNMSYSSQESGAGDMYISHALKTYFNFDPATRYIWRNCFTSEQWEDMVYEELAANRPVLYGGQAPEGGHQFVCDGYSDGYFHINWGWSGYGNGWFLLSALDPGLQGIGGFSGGYNSDQSMICGARPNTGSGNAWYPVYSTGSMKVNSSYQGSDNAVVELGFEGGGVYNYSPEELNLAFNLKFVSEAGNEYVSDYPTNLSFSGSSGLSVGGYNGFGVYIPADLEPGKYKGYLGFKTHEGNWQDVLFPLTVVSYVDLTVESDGSYTFADGVPVEKAKVRVTEFAPDGIVISGEPTRFNVTIENIGDVEYSGLITIKVFDKDTRYEELASDRISFSVAAGEVFNGYVDLTYTLPDGEYDVLIYDQYSDIVSDVMTLVVGKQPVKVSNIVLDKTEASMVVDDTLQLNATVVPEDADDKALTWSSSNPEIANVDQTGLVTAFTPGNVTITATSAADESISAKCEITVKAKVIEAEGVVLDRTEAEMTEGDTLTLTATVDPANTTDRILTWTSSDESVATVADGVVTALKPGTATITVSTANGKTASCVITVEAKVIYVTSVALDQKEIAAVEGTVVKLVATVLPEDATDKTLTWTSSNEAVATVDQDGTVHILSAGSAVITAFTTDGSGIKAECLISATSGIEAICGSASSVDILTINGLLIKKNAEAKDVENLAKGTYIIRVGDRTYKVAK